MPSEPDNKMDDLLKTYAKKRRDEAGAPLEMHAATRRMLQAEAAKLRPVSAPASGSWLDALRIFWPRVAFAAGILFVAGIVAITFLQPANEKQNEMQFAKQDVATPAVDRYTATESRPALTPAPAKPQRESVVALEDQISPPAPARREIKALPALTVAAEKDVVKKLNSLDVVQNEPLNNVALNRGAVAAPTAPAAPASEPVALGMVVAQSADKENRAASGPPTATALTAEAKSKNVADAKQTDSLARSLKEEKPLAQQQLNNATTRSRFANVQPVSRQKLSKATTAYDTTVLANFVVEQDGEQLRVTDADGSVYDGKVLNSEAAAVGSETQSNLAAGARRDTAKPALAQAGKDIQAQQPSDGPVAAASWNFRVSGTNRTLQQPVIVDGILFETAATNSLNQTATSAANGSLQFYRFAPAQAPAQQRGDGVSNPSAQNAAASSLSQSYGGQSMNLLNTRRIQGNVRIGATNQLPLDAVPDGNQR